MFVQSERAPVSYLPIEISGLDANGNPIGPFWAIASCRGFLFLFANPSQDFWRLDTDTLTATEIKSITDPQTATWAHGTDVYYTMPRTQSGNLRRNGLGVRHENITAEGGSRATGYGSWILPPGSDTALRDDLIESRAAASDGTTGWLFTPTNLYRFTPTSSPAPVLVGAHGLTNPTAAAWHAGQLLVATDDGLRHVIVAGSTIRSTTSPIQIPSGLRGLVSHNGSLWGVDAARAYIFGWGEQLQPETLSLDVDWNDDASFADAEQIPDGKLLSCIVTLGHRPNARDKYRPVTAAGEVLLDNSDDRYTAGASTVYTIAQLSSEHRCRLRLGSAVLFDGVLWSIQHFGVTAKARLRGRGQEALTSDIDHDGSPTTKFEPLEIPLRRAAAPTAFAPATLAQRAAANTGAVYRTSSSFGAQVNADARYVGKLADFLQTLGVISASVPFEDELGQIGFLPRGRGASTGSAADTLDANDLLISDFAVVEAVEQLVTSIDFLERSSGTESAVGKFALMTELNTRFYAKNIPAGGSNSPIGGGSIRHTAVLLLGDEPPPTGAAQFARSLGLTLPAVEAPASREYYATSGLNSNVVYAHHTVDNADERVRTIESLSTTDAAVRARSLGTQATQDVIEARNRGNDRDGIYQGQGQGQSAPYIYRPGNIRVVATRNDHWLDGGGDNADVSVSSHWLSPPYQAVAILFRVVNGGSLLYSQIAQAQQAASSEFGVYPFEAQLVLPGAQQAAWSAALGKLGSVPKEVSVVLPLWQTTAKRTARVAEIRMGKLYELDLRNWFGGQVRERGYCIGLRYEIKLGKVPTVRALFLLEALRARASERLTLRGEPVTLSADNLVLGTVAPAGGGGNPLTLLGDELSLGGDTLTL